jgi:hypothetical protein
MSTLSAPAGLVEGPHPLRTWVRPLLYAVLVVLAVIWIVPLA